jgi:WD40 repeat protein
MIPSNTAFILREHKDRVLTVTITGDGVVKEKVPASSFTLKEHTDWVSCLVVADDSPCSGSWDSSIRKWDMSTNRCITELLDHHDTVYTLVQVGGVLLSGSRDCCVK